MIKKIIRENREEKDKFVLSGEGEEEDVIVMILEFVFIIIVLDDNMWILDIGVIMYVIWNLKLLY